MENTSFGAENMTCTTMQSEGIRNFKLFLKYTSLVLMIVGLIGNGIVIFLNGCRMKTTINSTWFLNLAIADFIFTLSSIIRLLSYLGKWRTDTLEYIILMIFRLNLFASIFFLVVISLDRCVCTWKVVWAQNNRTLFRARIICVIVWVSSIGCSLPYIIIHDYTIFLVTFEYTVGFFIPFLIIVCSYIAIAVQIKRLKLRKQLRSYRLIMSVILAFFICYFPYHVCCFCVVKSSCNNSNHQITLVALDFSVYLINFNSCLNPFLYVFMCEEYKKKLKQSILLVLETAFTEDHLNFNVDTKGQEIQT